MAYIGAIHIHSSYSHDSKDSLETLHARCVERGIRFLGMTDHAEDLNEEIFKTYVQHCNSVSDGRVKIIPGLEYRFAGLKGMHLFALGLREWIDPQTPEQFFEQTRDTAQMTVLAHPILPKYTIPQVVLDNVDAIEVWNAGYNTRYLPDPKAIEIYRSIQNRREGVFATVGLDQHDSENDRELRIELPTVTDDPIATIRRGQFKNVGKTMKFDSRANFSKVGFSSLKLARAAFDVIERTQDKTARAIRGRNTGR